MLVYLTLLGVPMASLYTNDTGRNFIASAIPEVLSSVSIECLNRCDEPVQPALSLYTTSLLADKQSEPAPAPAVSPSNPTVPVTESLRHGEVVAIPIFP